METCYTETEQLAARYLAELTLYGAEDNVLVEIRHTLESKIGPLPIPCEQPATMQ